MKRDEWIGGIVIFIFGAITVLLSLRMPVGTFRMAGVGMFPLCLGILLMLLSSCFLFKLLLKEKKTAEEKERATEPPSSTRQLVLFFGAMLLATLLFNPFGYPLVAFLLMLALLRILGIKRWSLNIIVSGATAAGSYLLFVQWLQIPLPKGFIGL